MPDTMKERIARKLAAWRYRQTMAERGNELECARHVEKDWPRYVPAALELLDAMREPGPEIEGVSTMSISYLNGDIWTRFIDAIKEGK